MESSKSSPNSQALVEQMRAEIANRKGILADGKGAASQSNASKLSNSPLKKATTALNRAKARLEAAKKWPGFLRHVRCNHYAVGQALVESVKNINGETERLQKALASLDVKHRELARKHAVLLEEQKDGVRAREDIGRLLEEHHESLVLLSSKYDEFSGRHEELRGEHRVLRSEQDKKRRELGTRLTYLEGAAHSMAQHFNGAFQLIVQNLTSPESLRAIAAPGPDSEVSKELDSLLLDAFYLAFEDQFRGSRELIKERLFQYGSTLDELKKRIPNAIGLDIGCGRGEWLEVLQENGIEARGVDMNARMADQCLSFGLDVVCGDGIAFLRGLPDNSLAVISGFHIVEHLALGQLLELFQQSHRVLQPGGVAIFETPNPEVQRVSTYTFYFDPTHRNPLPPELLSFMGTNAGFSETCVERFQPLMEDGKILGYQDYACVFTK